MDRIIKEIRDECTRQKILCDDESARDWVHSINLYLNGVRWDLCDRNDAGYRLGLVRIAGTAMAAIDAFDRITTLLGADVGPGYPNGAR